MLIIIQITIDFIFIFELKVNFLHESARSKKDQSCSKAPDITGFCGTHAGA